MPPIDYTLPLDQLPDPLPIEPLTKPFDVTITPPGSKSITCRAYVLAALAQGESKIIRPLRADDTDRLLEALCTLGAEARWQGEDVFIKGVAGRFPRGGKVNLGDGGTPTRFMIACACLAAEPVIVDGSKRMRERPIAEGVDMLRQLGARIEYVEEEGRLPVRVAPSADVTAGALRIGRTASSQFVSAIMLIAPFLSAGLQLRYEREITSAAYVGLTRFVLRDFGATFGEHTYANGEPKEDRLQPSRIAGRDYRVFFDASAAVYWLLSVAITDGAKARLKPYSPTLPSDLRPRRGMDQPDFGVFAAWRDIGVARCGFEGALVLESTCSRPGLSLDAQSMPDGALVLATYAAVAEGSSRLTGLRTLRVKETDRIAALANELRKVGCEVATGEDWIEINPIARAGGAQRAATVRERSSSDESKSNPLPHGRGSSEARDAERRATDDPIIIETYNDHRMAMAFAVLGLTRPGGRTLAIRNPACVAKSYPGFWRDFARLYQ